MLMIKDQFYFPLHHSFTAYLSADCTELLLCLYHYEREIIFEINHNLSALHICGFWKQKVFEDTLDALCIPKKILSKLLHVLEKV